MARGNSYDEAVTITSPVHVYVLKATATPTPAGHHAAGARAVGTSSQMAVNTSPDRAPPASEACRRRGYGATIGDVPRTIRSSERCVSRHRT